MSTLNELDARIVDRIKSQNAQLESINLVGGETSEQAADFREEVSDTSMGDLIQAGFRSMNAATGIAQWAERKVISQDPNFKLDDHRDELLGGLPSEYWNSFRGVRSKEEGLALRADLQQELADMRIIGASGARGFVAAGLAGIVDVDAPLVFFTGGTYAGSKMASMLATTSIRNSRAAHALTMGVAGAEAGFVTETANVLVRPTGEWTDIPTAALGGMAFGTILGAAAGKSIQAFKDDDRGTMDLNGFFRRDPAENANASISRARAEFQEAVADGSAGRVDYTAEPNISDDVFTFDEINDSTLTEGMQDISAKSAKFLADAGIDKQVAGAFNTSTPIGKAAQMFYNFIRETPVATDWDALMKSNSNTAKVFAYKSFESAAGIVRNNRSSAMLQEMYTNKIASPVTEAYPELITAWAGSRNTRPGFVNRNRDDVIQEFNREVMTELQSLRHSGKSAPGSDDNVKAMAQAINKASGEAVDIMQDTVGGRGVRGSENLKKEDGWFRQLWRGDKMQSTMNQIDQQLGKGAGKKAVVSTLTDTYMSMHNIARPIAERIANAVVRGALARQRGIDTNLSNMLASEGAEFMEQFLTSNGFSAVDAQKVIDSMRGAVAERGKQSYLKHRTDVDLRAQIVGTNFTLMDLVDTDIVGVWTSYSRGVAGASALARQGIQKADKKRIIDVILSEEAAAGKQTLNREQLEGMFSYFEGGAFAGGLNPWARRALQLTNLGLLNTLGLTQVAETGVQVAAVGVDAFFRAGPKELRDMLSGKNSALSEELRPWTAVIDGEHNVFMDHLALDDMRPDPGAFAEVGQFMDKMLAKGSRIQGYLSGFYKMKQLQQRTAVRGMLYRLADMYRKDSTMSDQRLYDMGFTDPKMVSRIGKYFRDGTVQFDQDGDILRLGFDKWNPEDILDFALILNRHTNQVVQKAMRGESSVWMHKDMGAVLMHLKSFTVLAMQKQLIRNARIMDPEATMGFIYGLGTAAVTYSAQQVIRGRPENLDAEHIAKGAFMLSNMTGWMPMWSDPLMTMLGMDKLKFQHEGAVGAGGGVIGVPPVIPTLNRMAQAPVGFANAFAGHATPDDVYAMQATPIVGNLYGMSYMFNSMRDTIREERRAARAAERKATRAEAKETNPAPKPELSTPNIPGLRVSDENREALEKLME